MDGDVLGKRSSVKHGTRKKITKSNASDYASLERSGCHLQRLLSTSHKILSDYLSRALEGQGLTLSQWLLLQEIDSGIDQHPARLCNRMYRDSGALTRLIDRLEECAYVERFRIRADRRRIHLRVTGTGRNLIVNLAPRMDAVSRQSLSVFSNSEIRELDRLLQKLIAGLPTRRPMRKSRGQANLREQ